MIKKPFIFVISVLVLIIAGCIKETYDMNKLSDKVKYSPTLALAAVNGDITLRDAVKQNDTVVYDSDKFVRIIFHKDSVINLKLKDYYDLSNMVSFKKGYKIGEVTISNFQDSIPIKLSTISPTLTNGTYIFPPLGTISLSKQRFKGFSNFKKAVFSSGTLTLSVANNLPAPLNSINITLVDSIANTTIGNFTVPPVAVGTTQSANIDLADKTLNNYIIANIVLNGSPGTAPNSVLVNINSAIQVKIKATNLKVQSGQIVLPVQPINSLNGSDVISFDPGSNVEIESLKVLTGNIGYTLISSGDISGTFTLTLPKATKNGTPITEVVAIGGKTNLTQSIILDNTVVDLSSYITQPFNKIPVNYSMAVNFTNNYINFDMNDSIFFSVNMLNPNFDYVKGYFGQLSKQINQDNLKTGLDEFLNHITGQIHISDPSIKLIYSNSFGIPIEVTLNATGKRNSQSVNLGLAPFTIAYPTSLTTRDVTSSFTIDKNNSLLPDLISLPPSEITFSGSGKMNPAGTAGGRNNYIFGNSRFLGSVEVNVPLQLWINNLQLSDTLDNFLKLKSTDNSSFLDSLQLDSLQVNIVANNGFPLGASLKVMLYDSINKVVLKTIVAADFIKPAPVDANGKVTGKTESSVTVNFSKTFFTAVNSANKVIFLFTLNTTGNGTNDVKIYSDYSISFKASVFVKANINPKLPSIF